MKIGVGLKINVSEIDKSKMFTGKKGTYLDATVFIDVDTPDQYGNHGMITQSWQDQEKGEGPILGNAKVFWKGESQSKSQADSKQAQQTTSPAPEDFTDDIPF